MSFLNSIEKKSKKFESPFTHWELNEPLTEEQVNEIVKADIANPIEHNLNYDGPRAIDGGEGKFRDLFSELNITKNLNEKLEIWSYKSLNETTRIAEEIKKYIS